VGAGLGQIEVLISPGGLEDDSASDLDGMVGEAFVVAAEQGDIDGGGNAVFPFPVHQQTQQLTVEVVHGVVVVAQLGGLAWITGLHNVFGVIAEIDSDAAHFGEVAVDLPG